MLYYVDARFGFESSEYSFSEGPGVQQVVVVLLEHELTSPVSVQFTVADLSASEFALLCVAVCDNYIVYTIYFLNALHLSYNAAWGNDYDYQQASVTFLSGEKSGDTHSFYIDINRDAVVEATESFQLHLSCRSPLASIDGQRRVSTVYITDQTSMRQLSSTFLDDILLY